MGDPDRGTELTLIDVQSAGIGQFFCERCRYRHDRYVGPPATSA